jgi:hypothetical protein
MLRIPFSACLGIPILLGAAWAWAAAQPDAEETPPSAPELPDAGAVPPRTSAGDQGVSLDQDVSLGLRTGWAFPIGSLASNDSLGANFDGMLPVWLDVGYRLNNEFYVGGYFQWGLAFVSNEVCPQPLSCSATDLRFGANLHWHFKSRLQHDAFSPSFDPWIGVGAGYEITSIHISANGSKAHETDRGFEFANLQLGGDYTGIRSLRIGGFASLSIAEYRFRTVSNPNGSTDQSIADPSTPGSPPAVHLWLMVGVRTQYDL